MANFDPVASIGVFARLDDPNVERIAASFASFLTSAVVVLLEGQKLRVLPSLDDMEREGHKIEGV